MKPTKKKYYRTYVFTIMLSKGVHYYAGKRVSKFADPKDDDYKGSGKVISNAFKKYGYGMYTNREWQDHESEELMEEFEELLVDECKEKYGSKCVNIAKGGKGGNLLKYATEDKKKEASKNFSIATSRRMTLPGVKENLAKKTSNSWNDESIRSARIDGIILAHSNPDTKSKRSNSIKSAYLTQEVQEHHRTAVRLATRTSKYWQHDMYNILWNEWCCTIDKHGNRLKKCMFARHLRNTSIAPECTGNDVNNLLRHFNRVLSNEEELLHQHNLQLAS